MKSYFERTGNFIHKELAKGRWFELSLKEQLGNIGSEVSRAIKWKEKDENLYWQAVWRGLDLFDLTLADKRWLGRLREIGRAREVFCDAVWNEIQEYRTTLQDIDRYFLQFALAARRNTENAK